MRSDPDESQLESSLQLCAWMAALRLLILVLLFSGAFLLSWLAPEPGASSPRSAWTEEFELKPLSDYDPAP